MQFLRLSNASIWLGLIFIWSIGGSSSAASLSVRQLPYATLTPQDMRLPVELEQGTSGPHFASLPTGRRVPAVIEASLWVDPALASFAVPLPEADCLSNDAFRKRRYGQLLRSNNSTSYFVPEVVLVKFRAHKHVSALRVEPMRELEAVIAFSARDDVQFAELNALQYRQFAPNDPLLNTQWHHAVIGSFEAWNRGMGTNLIRIGIVDTPFQMDHPDLAANVAAGWSVVSNAPITSSAGIDHSTIGAGLVAAVVNNGIGVAGAGNCQILPIHINASIDDMYNAVIWAADHDVRVVNISWTGADSPSLNEAGLYLKEHAHGLLAMGGLNELHFQDYPGHPHIYCISMTDAADNQRSSWGEHIDFAAPGYGVYSTASGSGYTTAWGTSYSAPLFCGVVAVLFSINPTLSPDEVVEILQATADDKGQPGWDQYYGWGRIHFGRATQATQETQPRIVSVVRSTSSIEIDTTFRESVNYTLWKSIGLNPPNWTQVTNATVTITNGVMRFADPASLGSAAFYRVGVTRP